MILVGAHTRTSPGQHHPSTRRVHPHSQQGGNMILDHYWSPCTRIHTVNLASFWILRLWYTANRKLWPMLQSFPWSYWRVGVWPDHATCIHDACMSHGRQPCKNRPGPMLCVVPICRICIIALQECCIWQTMPVHVRIWVWYYQNWYPVYGILPTPETWSGNTENFKTKGQLWYIANAVRQHARRMDDK